MQAFFDKLQAELADSLDPTTNTVGHFVKQIYSFAQGGLADTNENSDLNLLQRITTAANKSTTGADAVASGGKYGDSATGSGFYNSAPYIAQHYTQLGKFFTGQGNMYQEKGIEQPIKGQPVKSENPTDFYGRWYNRMRNFAEAAEVASRGQETVRSR